MLKMTLVLKRPKNFGQDRDLTVLTVAGAGQRSTTVKSHPTQRAPDWWESPSFWAVCVA